MIETIGPQMFGVLKIVLGILAIWWFVHTIKKRYVEQTDKSVIWKTFYSILYPFILTLPLTTLILGVWWLINENTLLDYLIVIIVFFMSMGITVILMDKTK